MKQFVRNFYNTNRSYIVTVLNWFIAAVVLGGLVFFIKPDLINQIANIFSSKFGPAPAKDSTLAWQIFIQNAQACALALFGGIVLGFFPFLIVFLNGLIIGFVVLALVATPGNPLNNILYAILALVPHGIFELPAFLISASLGLRLGTEWLKGESEGQRLRVLARNLKRAVYAVPFLVVILIIAAFVEVFVSGRFVGNM